MTEQNTTMRSVLCIDIRPARQVVLFRQTGCDFSAMPRLVLPSPSAILSRKIGMCTAERRDIYITGSAVGRECLGALAAHIRQGCRAAMDIRSVFKLYKTTENAVAAGMEILESCPDGYAQIHADKIDMDFWSHFTSMIALEKPALVAVTALDNETDPEMAQTGNACRGGAMHVWNTVLRSHAEQGAPPQAFMLTETAAPLPYLTALQNGAKCFVTESGVASLLGLFSNTEIYERSFRRGLVLLNTDEMHVTAFLVWRGRIFGVYGQHTQGMDCSKILHDLAEFRLGWLPDEAVRNAGGHGTAFADVPPEAEGFPAMYVTGQKRKLFEGHGKIYESPEQDVFSGCLGMACAIDAMAGSE